MVNSIQTVTKEFASGAQTGINPKPVVLDGLDEYDDSKVMALYNVVASSLEGVQDGKWPDKEKSMAIYAKALKVYEKVTDTVPHNKLAAKSRSDKKNHKEANTINDARRNHFLGLLEDSSAPTDFFPEEYLAEILRIEDETMRDCFASYASGAAIVGGGVEALDEEFLGAARGWDKSDPALLVSKTSEYLTTRESEWNAAPRRLMPGSSGTTRPTSSEAPAHTPDMELNVGTACKPLGGSPATNHEQHGGLLVWLKEWGVAENFFPPGEVEQMSARLTARVLKAAAVSAAAVSLQGLTFHEFKKHFSTDWLESMAAMELEDIRLHDLATERLMELH